MSLLLSPISTIWRNWAEPIASWGQRPLIHPSQPNGASNTLTGCAIKYLQPDFYNLIADGSAGPGCRDSLPAFSHPTPGMLSAALQGNLPPVSHQPPTPPRHGRIFSQK